MFILLSTRRDISWRLARSAYHPIAILSQKAWQSKYTHTMATSRFIDVGVNLTDPVFRGLYHGKQKHADDMVAVLERAKAAGVRSMILTGTSLKESREAVHLGAKHNFYTTVGCHPTKSKGFDSYGKGPNAYLSELDNLISQHLEGPGRVVAVGECGLDYDRLHHSPAETQQRCFRMQLSLAKKHNLPLFLHSRSAHVDFVRILREEGFGEDGGRAVGGNGGLVHSFTGTSGEAEELIAMGFYFSVNGVGLKTEENIEVARGIPLDRLMLETDAPWCSMRPSHASWAHLDNLPTDTRKLYLPRSVKPERFKEGLSVLGRNEPAAIGGVAWVMHLLLDVSFEELTEQVWKNTVEVFQLTELENENKDSST
ncbi:hypothetical protein DFP72DRAFT_997632 [Ephemerocybe angulata]|uniref:Mg-dependent DNase n=1 Tax=Ephemerocybe angulata TaxID=980116 RepID=A0A8H6IL12_9AGAR|nr:hypothetical protein DFP72DRAFT_997632 [Tulosesus angulatus]